MSAAAVAIHADSTIQTITIHPFGTILASAADRDEYVNRCRDAI